MRPKVSSLLLLFLAAHLWAEPNSSNGQKFSPRVRSFHFTYDVTVKDIPAGAKRVRVWIPVPQTDKHQTVRVLAVRAPAETQMTREPGYGNRMMYAEIENPSTKQMEFTLEYEVARREYSRGDYAELKQADHRPAVVPASMNRLIAPDALIPTDGKIKTLALDVTGSTRSSALRN